MRNMKIGQLLSLAFALLIALLIIVGGFSAFRLSSLDTHIEIIAEDRMPKLVMIDKWLTALLQSARHVRNVLIYDKEKMSQEIVRLRDNAEICRESFEYFQKKAISETDRQTVQSIADIRARYLAAEAELIKHAEAGKMDEARSVLIEKTPRCWPNISTYYRNSPIIRLPRLPRKSRPVIRPSTLV